MGLRRPLGSLVGLALWLAAGAATAQNPREIPIGGRTATMGGAGTAAGNDSALPYLNPAGMAGVPGDIFGISASLYGYTHRAFEGVFYPTGVDPAFGRVVLESESFSTRSVLEMPTSVMYFEGLGPAGVTPEHHLGFALVIPSARRIELLGSSASSLPDSNGRIQSTQVINVRSTDYWVGPSYALGVSERLRVGASLFGVLSRTVQTLEGVTVVEIAGGAATSSRRVNAAQEATALSVAPVVGFQLELAPTWWVGAAVAAPSLPLLGEITAVNGSTGVGTEPTSGQPTASADAFTLRGDYRVGTPLRLNAGLARDDRKGVSFAADVHYYAARKEAYVMEGVARFDRFRSGEVSRHFYRRQRVTTDLTSVVDLSAGVEVALSPVIAGRAGAFTDFANTQKIEDRPEDRQRLRLDRFGGTLGLGFLFGSFDSTIGVVYAHGQGKFGVADSFGANLPPLPAVRIVAVDATEDTIFLVLSGAVTSKEAKKTIEEALPVPVELPSVHGEPPAPPPTPRAPAAPTSPAPTSPPPPAEPPPAAPPPAAPPPVAPPPAPEPTPEPTP